MEAPDRGGALADAWPALIAMAAVVLLLRPAMMVLDGLLRNNAVLPGVTSLVRWQSHWHVVRQGWPFFQDDFAGRIANRVMQTANALRESVVSSIRAVWYITVYGLTAIALLVAIDWRLALPTLVWFAVYALFLRHFVPRLRDLARSSSEARSLLMGRVVDSYTNILSVKLFARARDEDAFVREALDAHTAAMAAHMRVITRFMATLAAMNALLLVATAIIGLLLRRGGHRAAAGLADRQRRRLGQLGSHRHLREHRGGAGGHADHRRAPHPRRPPGCARTGGRPSAARRIHPVRARGLRVRPR
jgi:ATP-binding cassette subfamily B multidrug efflux pump